MTNFRTILMYSFALFAMFFGSGNLVFPIQIGMSSGVSWTYGFLGLFVTGILLPFLGLFVIKLHKGNYYSFFKEAGWFAGILLPFFTLSLLGPFAVVPRCITVAHGGIESIFPNTSLFLFSLIFCAFTFILSLKDSMMIKALGKWLSPLLLSALLALFIIGILKTPDMLSAMNSSKAFSGGFITGYQTMDLFAAFFFSALVFTQMKAAMPDSISDWDVIKFALKPSIIGAILLSLVYMGLVYLGAHYAHLIKNTAPEMMLLTIAKNTIGFFGALFVACAMVLSCITTAFALTNIYARYICNILNLDEKRFPFVLLGAIIITFVISLLDFKGIASFLAPVLEVSYPGIIALTIMSILFKGQKFAKAFMFYALTFLMLIYKYLI